MALAALANAIAAPAPTIAIIAADADPQGERGIEAGKSGSALKFGVAAMAVAMAAPLEAVLQHRINP